MQRYGKHQHKVFSHCGGAAFRAGGIRMQMRNQAVQQQHESDADKKADNGGQPCRSFARSLRHVN